VKHDLEALLFSTDAPLTSQRLKNILTDADGKAIRAAIDELNQEYEEQQRAFSIVEFGGGWQLASRPEYMPLIQKLYKGRRYVRLSRAALEVLAIVAYRQPVTRMEIEEIRGVQVSGVLQTLTERNLVTVVGRSEAVGNPILYGTTRDFLNHMGLNGLHQLPSLPELEGVIDNRDDIKQFAMQIGEQISDEDFETIDVRGDEIIFIQAEAGENDGDEAEPDSGEANDQTESTEDDTPDIAAVEAAAAEGQADVRDE